MHQIQIKDAYVWGRRGEVVIQLTVRYCFRSPNIKLETPISSFLHILTYTCSVVYAGSNTMLRNSIRLLYDQSIP